MDNTTPIQASLNYWNRLQKHAITPELRSSAAIFIKHLEPLIEEEKQFVERIWKAASESAYSCKRVYGDSEFDIKSHEIDKTEFLNQLYPKP